MPAREVAHRAIRHSALLTGTSVLALMLAMPAAYARPLFGGSNASSAVTSAMNAAMAGVQQAQQATQQSRNSLAAAVRAIQTMQAVQAAAHNAAAASGGGVPNGLTPGGLVVAPNTNDPAVWQGAYLPTQSGSGGQTTVTVQQTAQKAILTWSSFNVGANTQLYFNQSAGNSSAGNNWIVLNRVIDPSGVPSQILGSIKAEGTVYLINQNGIIFGGASQVNVNSLLVSSLPFMGDPFNLATMVPGSAAYDAAVNANAGNSSSQNRGNGGNTNFLNYGIAGVGPYQPILGPGDIFGSGNVTVQPGAHIQVGSLGYALLAAPNVTNAGTIEAPNGQVILAAGVSLSLNQPTNATNAWLYPVMTDAVGHVGGVDVTPLYTVTNTGLLDAETGNVTLTGGAVKQMGVVAVTTGITRPGAITITAVDEFEGSDFATVDAQRDGPVTFGTGSITAILPEEDGETTVSTQAATTAFKPGNANITGGSVTFQNGSLLDAPGATVSVTAIAGNQSPSDPTVNGRVYVDNGAVIDVAGLSNIELPVADTLVTIGAGTGLTANDLADSPLDRNGVLIGKSVVIDSTVSGVRADGEAWVGSPILAMSVRCRARSTRCWSTAALSLLPAARSSPHRGPCSI